MLGSAALQCIEMIDMSSYVQLNFIIMLKVMFVCGWWFLPFGKCPEYNLQISLVLPNSQLCSMSKEFQLR